MLSGDYLVGEWRFSPASGEIRRHAGDGAAVRLEPKVAAVLACLLARPDEVVAKEALIAAVWPDTFVTDSAVFRHVSELRRALGDDSRDPRYIETVPKRGYRLTARVARLRRPPRSDRAIASVLAAATEPPSIWVRRASLAAITVLLLVLAPIAWRSAVTPARVIEPAPATGPTPPARPRTHPGDPIAYQTLAFAELFEDRVDCASYRKALELLAEALARDPGVVPAYASVMDVSIAASVLGCAPTGPSLQRVEELLATARAHGLDSGRVDRAEGHLLLWQRWEPVRAARRFKRAQGALPAAERSDVGYAAALAAEGRIDDAVVEARRALATEPTHPGTNWSLAVLLYFAGKPEDATAQLRHTLELHPGFAPASNLLALILLRQGDADAALAVLPDAAPSAADGDRFATVPALVYAAAGDEASAHRLRRAWEARAADEWVAPTAMAVLYEGLGERRQALEWLRRAVEEGDAWAVLLPVDPTFASLREEPELERLLAAVGSARGRS